MDTSPFSRLSGELRNKIYASVFEHEPQMTLLNLTKWQVPKQMRTAPHLSNVMQNHIALTQTCRQIRHEALGLFYSTNVLSLAMADFEERVSPVMAPPREACEKFLQWREIVGSEVLKAVRQVHVELQYHYLGPRSTLDVDTKAAAMLYECFHPDANIIFWISVNLPLPEMEDSDGYPRLNLMDVGWALSQDKCEWEKSVANEVRRLFDDYDGFAAFIDPNIPIHMVFCAACFLESGMNSFASIGKPVEHPVFGPPLPPVMEAEWELNVREQRRAAWEQIRCLSVPIP